MTAETRMLKQRPKLGEGIYTMPDIAEILHLDYKKVNYWFREYVKTRLEAGTDHRYFFTAGRTDAVNFYTLIETYVYYQLREHKFTSKKIIKAHNELSRYLKTPYPFAKSEILVSGGEILFRPEDDKDSIISADQKMQYQIQQVIEPFSKKIEFSGQTGLPESFHPMGKNRAVIVDPRRQFGKPVIKGTNITVSNIHDLYSAGDASVSFIASLYNISEESVKDALEYMQAA